MREAGGYYLKEIASRLLIENIQTYQITLILCDKIRLFPPLIASIFLSSIQHVFLEQLQHLFSRPQSHPVRNKFHNHHPGYAFLR